MQNFQADFGYVDKINNNKTFKKIFFQFLALPNLMKSKKNVLRFFPNFFFVY